MKSTPAPFASRLPRATGRPRVRLAALGATVALLVIALAVPACRTGPRDIRERPAYPAQVPPAQTLDIQVFRHETLIEFTNTTAQPFGPSTLWLNRQFGRPIDGLAVGQTLRLPLTDFRNRFDEPFRAGGFLAVELPERLVVAELHTEARDGEPVVYSLIVVGTGL